MPEFRLTQISDTHLARRLPTLTDNFHRVSEYIDARRPDLVINSGDLAFDGPTGPDDLEFAKSLHDALPVACRYLPGNHDIGDNPTALGPAPSQPATEADRQAFPRRSSAKTAGASRPPAGAFIGLNSLVMNTGLASEAEQFDWLASQLAAAKRQAGGAVPAQAALSECARRSRTRGDRDPLRADAGAKPAGRDAALASTCGWSPAATSTSAGILPLAMSGTSGRRRPALSFPTSGRR